MHFLACNCCFFQVFLMVLEATQKFSCLARVRQTVWGVNCECSHCQPGTYIHKKCNLECAFAMAMLTTQVFKMELMRVRLVCILILRLHFAKSMCCCTGIPFIPQDLINHSPLWVIEKKVRNKRGPLQVLSLHLLIVGWTHSCRGLQSIRIRHQMLLYLCKCIGMQNILKGLISKMAPKTVH